MHRKLACTYSEAGKVLPPFWKENQGLSMPSCYNYKRFCCPQPLLLSIAARILK